MRTATGRRARQRRLRSAAMTPLAMTGSEVTGGALLGMGFGLGLFLLLRIVAPPRVAVSVALARVDAAAVSPSGPGRPRRVAVAAAGGQRGRWSRRLAAVEALLGERYAATLAERGLLSAGLRSDLALLGTDERAYTARKLLLALAALVLTPLLLTPIGAALGAPWLLAAWVSLLAAAGVFLLPDARVRRAASARRRDFATAIAAYLDLVAMRAASGSGVAEALRDAARIGTGGAFTLLREALDDARMSGQPPAWGLRLLGEELDVVELRQLSAQLQLIDASGAQAEASLRAKADALRARQLTDAHGGANAQSQTMLIAQVLLGLGFLIFLGYPAVAQVLTI